MLLNCYTLNVSYAKPYIYYFLSPPHKYRLHTFKAAHRKLPPKSNDYLPNKKKAVYDDHSYIMINRGTNVSSVARYKISYFLA